MKRGELGGEEGATFAITECVRSRDVNVVADGTIVVEVCCGGWLGKVKGDVGSVCVGEVGYVVMLLHIFLRFLFVVVSGTVVVDGSAPTGSVSPELAASTSRRASAASSCSTCCCFSSCACSASSIASSLSRQASASSFALGE